MRLELQSTINKSPMTVFTSLSEGITVFTKSGHITASANNKKLLLHTFQLKPEKICRNIRNPEVAITTIIGSNNTSIIKAILKYEIAESNVLKRLIYNLFGKLVLKNKVAYYLADFKFRVEKWA
ncbi:hypothetical protein Q2T40_15880 [Winogradskyella maritima]|uniref:Uncharacterized protein n=1 Tax=Winogradskyella maritima TaxID=1517766 RepID=A0ABV8AJD0_9FLAO|nr:hypothetical protein [Winogradskyella maritima]